MTRSYHLIILDMCVLGFENTNKLTFVCVVLIQFLNFQNTRMLIVVILLFLVTEIPAAMIFSLHVSTVALQITYIQRHYHLLNKLLIIRWEWEFKLSLCWTFRNVLIVVSYPFRFAIYCGMSQQFREVVRSMLTKRAYFPCDKSANRYGRTGGRTGNETTQLTDDRR